MNNLNLAGHLVNELAKVSFSNMKEEGGSSLFDWMKNNGLIK